MSPLVSVIVPSYNHARFIEKRLKSILEQNYQDFELIILDDVSPDNSRDIIENYKYHPKVSHVIFNNINSGSTFKQWNKGVELAKGKYIWIAESDDVAEYDFLSQMVEALKSNNDVVIAFCQSSKMDEGDKITGSWLEWTKSLKHSEKFNNPFFMEGRKFIHKYLIYRNVIPNASAVLFRKDTYLKVGGPAVDLRTNGDWELWLKMLMIGNVYYCNRIMNNFRYHNGSVIAKASSNQESKLKTKIRLIQNDIDMRNCFKQYLTNNCSDARAITKLNVKEIKKSLLIFNTFNFLRKFFK
ncbi:glycosyltransferase [Acinetobacter bereziniae]|uniref:glycosyltransferase n=1 Tax=Acinetobacter bereziniae TaxID=106648 RepID=UPI0018FFEF21|nr:glycosyltransferase [Acinetobacter bereziniae]MBJ8553722.1 glycosyltransferase [Acinetobacter bereziniae]MDM1785484.1 glycosyltransferase [Acinetobacter bereziniae]